MSRSNVFRSLALNSGNRHHGFGIASFGSEDNTEELAHLSIHDTQFQLSGHSPTDPNVPFLSVDTDDSAISCELQTAFNHESKLGGGGKGGGGGGGASTNVGGEERGGSGGLSSSLEVRSDHEGSGSPATIRSSTPTHALPRPSTPRSNRDPPSKIVDGCFVPVVQQPPPPHYDVSGNNKSASTVGESSTSKLEVSLLSVNNNNHSNSNSASHSRRDSAISVDPPGGDGGGLEDCEYLYYPPDGEGTKAFDAAVFDLLKVSAEQLAIQITLMDIPVFKAIGPEELTSCAWTRKDKVKLAPNIVHFTRRFNHINFWVQKEILSRESLKVRSEVMAHFIKVAKKLFDLNNLHSTKAIVSALQSVAIFRMTKTWMNISKRDRTTFERITDVFSEAHNFKKIREHMESIRLQPCIPHMGMYLTDLVYIDVAHPYSGGMESAPRKNAMNNILRVIADYQDSCKMDLGPVMPYVQSYFNSFRYIEELQKFIEDDNFRLSKKLEPGTHSPNDKLASKSFRGVADFSSPQPKKGSAHLLFTPQLSCGAAIESQSGASKFQAADATVMAEHVFVPGHRKTRSLGKDFNYIVNAAGDLVDGKCASLPPNIDPSRHLIDGSAMDADDDQVDPASRGNSLLVTVSGAAASSSSRDFSHNGEAFYGNSRHGSLRYGGSRESGVSGLSGSMNASSCFSHGRFGDASLRSDGGASYRSDAGGAVGAATSFGPSIGAESSGTNNGGEGFVVPQNIDVLQIPDGGGGEIQDYRTRSIIFEGCLKRKPLLKHGRKPTVKNWTKYWVQLRGPYLVYYPNKALGGTDRPSFKSEPCKVVSILGWMTLLKSDETEPEPDSFMLSNDNGTQYKFRAGTNAKALEWCHFMTKAANSNKRPIPENLISLD